VPSWLAGVGDWQQQLRSELATLPETMRLLRESATNMHVVTTRLVEATAALEHLTATWTRMAEAQRRFDEMAGAFRPRREGGDAGDPTSAAIDDLRESFMAMAQLNPFWPRTEPSSSSSSSSSSKAEPRRGQGKQAPKKK
jgi:hypothetical protein